MSTVSAWGAAWGAAWGTAWRALRGVAPGLRLRPGNEITVPSRVLEIDA